ncbi:STAS domain-containing protein [Streptomyces sp. NPDC059506]|uniref:STAS domain-containing protein n=1 Tax=Streptomyces TaxID=1883 RepID=UPI000CAA2347|nr:STAS domain-containing protein [Streptomyces sp. SCUT-3]PLW71210.1 anti-sigma factor antagonist [Streptomyces sp. DJ]QMV21209.1 anti-sigma factor antagonist [Streptomyces sp. SCUT-3]
MNRALPELTVAVHRERGNAVRVTVAGDLDYNTAPELRRALDDVPFTPGVHVVLDLSALTFCDSSGITVLVAAHRLATDAGGSVSLAAVPPAVARIFGITGLDQVFTLHPTVEDALSADRER